MAFAAIFVGVWSWNMGVDLMTQSETNLGRFQSQGLAYEIVFYSLTRGIIPIIVAAFFSLYTVVIGAVEYFRIRGIDIGANEKQRFLLSSRLRFIVFLFPILTIFGLYVSLLSARFATSQVVSFTTLPYGDLAYTALEVFVFSLYLLASAVLQGKAQIRWPKPANVVVISLIAIILNVISVTTLDIAIYSLL